MDVIGIRTEGLGDATYILVHEGHAVVVDPQRDVGRFIDALAPTGARPRFVLETHVHNDYLSGGIELAARTGAQLVLPAAAGAAFRHVAAFHLEPLDVGAFTLLPLHTPGHTPEHTSYVVMVGDEPTAILTGGSLLVGSAGRTDLLGSHRAAQLARLQFQSIRRLAAYPDEVGILPTHGAGSFCTSSAVGDATSTVGQERRDNPLLAHRDVEAFVDAQTTGLGPYPAYYRFMGPMNLAGPPPMPTTEPPSLTVEEARRSGATIVDMRPREAHASGHLPESMGIELGDTFGVWVGWLVPHRDRLALVADRDQDVAEAVTQLARIGMDDVVGVIGSLAGVELASFSTATSSDLVAAVAAGRAVQILDVREPPERTTGYIDGSIGLHVATVVADPPSLDPDQPVWVVCGSGFRSTIAGGVLRRAGLTPIVVTTGGVAEVLAGLGETATSSPRGSQWAGTEATQEGAGRDVQRSTPG